MGDKMQTIAESLLSGLEMICERTPRRSCFAQCTEQKKFTQLLGGDGEVAN